MSSAATKVLDFLGPEWWFAECHLYRCTKEGRSMIGLLLATSLGLGLDLGTGTGQRLSAESPVLQKLPPVHAPAKQSFVVVARPEPADDSHPNSSGSEILIVDQPELPTTLLEPPKIQTRYFYNGEEVDASEFFRRLHRRK
jgi:hypothetical protein